MSGKRIKIGARETYFPPFVNERFPPRPYWACTFAALLNGANVAFLGNKPPTHDEIKKLAAASGDPDLEGGANSSEMLKAMKVHYDKTMHLEALNAARARERLSSGWALVAGMSWRRMPMPWRRHAKNFMKGHRVTLIGWNGKETWILDPMAPKGSGWTGEPIPWSVVERAWWPGEQLWFAEGMFRKPPRVEVLDKVPGGEWRVPIGNRLVLRSGKNPRVIVRKFKVGEQKSGQFDAIVEIIPKSGSLGRFIRISRGDLKGMYIPMNEQVRLKPKPGSAGGTKKSASATTVAKQPAAADPKNPDFLAGQQQQYDAIKKHVGPAVTLPPRPK